MLARLKKEFCIWVVSPTDGSVRKFRFSMLRVLGVFLIIAFLSSSFVYVTGDYTRVQILRAKNYFTLQRTRSERDELISSNASLKTYLQDLLNEKGKAAEFQTSVEQRLLELTDVLETAQDFGVLPPEFEKHRKATVIDNSSEVGIGGDEEECTDSNDPACSVAKMSFSASDARASLSMERYNSGLDRAGKSDAVLKELEIYIDVLKKTPISSPAMGFVSSGYGYRRSPFSKRISFHKGLDISLPYGSSVHATADGVIKSVERTPTYGLVIDIEHSPGVVSRYAHLSKAHVNPGQRVCRGQGIGLVGSSGRSTGPHLHYEVRVNDKSVNPEKLINLGRALRLVA